MGKNCNEISLKETCATYREELTHALSLEIISGKDEKGVIFSACDKETADAKVLELFDAVVYMARKNSAEARAKEKYLQKTMGKRWMKLFNKGYKKSKYDTAEMQEEFEEELAKLR